MPARYESKFSAAQGWRRGKNALENGRNSHS
jgi:hypothetical protein